MAVTLYLSFPAGRYHATPWGHHVNEGLIEWPPSPWRVLRALVSVGYTTGVWNDEGPPAVARSLIEKLSTELPGYRLPPASGAHTRHYMPMASLEKGREKTSLVFDTWARVKEGELAIVWNLTLNTAEAALFATLAERLGYLGRSESWVTARLSVDEESARSINCYAETRAEHPGPGWEQIPLLAANPAHEYAAWHAERLAVALQNLPLPEGSKKPTKKRLAEREKAVAAYPVDLLDCLQKDTNWQRAFGWSQPPGSRRVLYWRPSDAIEAGAPRPKQRPRSIALVRSMLLSLTHAGGNNHALPPITRTLPQAEILHRTLIGIAVKSSLPPQVLTGCDEHHQPLSGPHEHAHILPLDLDADGHIEHILIWAPMGLDAAAQSAIRGARRTFTKNASEPLRLALAASGELADMAYLSEPFGSAIRHQFGVMQGAREWISLTPFVPPRFVKKKGKNSIEGQIMAELMTRGFAIPREIELVAPISTTDSTEPQDLSWMRFRHYVIARRTGPQPRVRYGFALRLKFEEPAVGPISLGYASHFGLGRFCPIEG